MHKPIYFNCKPVTDRHTYIHVHTYKHSFRLRPHYSAHCACTIMSLTLRRLAIISADSELSLQLICPLAQMCRHVTPLNFHWYIRLTSESFNCSMLPWS